MKREKLEALKELEAKATAGPWEVYATRGSDKAFYREGVSHQVHSDEAEIASMITNSSAEDSKNSKFIAAARNSLPQLLRIVEAAMELLANEDVKRDMQDTAIFDKLARAIGGYDDQ